VARVVKTLRNAPASVQIVLKYLDFSHLPTQTELATEMNTDINYLLGGDLRTFRLTKEKEMKETR